MWEQERPTAHACNMMFVVRGLQLERPIETRTERFGRYSARTVRHYCTLESDPMRPRACAAHAPPYHVMCVVLSRAAEVVRPWYYFPVLWPKETLKYLSNKFRLWKSEIIAEIKSVLGHVIGNPSMSQRGLFDKTHLLSWKSSGSRSKRLHSSRLPWQR